MNDLKPERQPLKIKDSKAFEIFMDIERTRLLRPFLQQPRSIAEAARLSSESIKKMSYWVEKFMDSGLLRKVSPASSRQGATYQATAQHFVLEGIDTLLLLGHIKAQFDPLWQTFIDGICRDSERYAESWDFHIFPDESGNFVRHFAPSWDRENFNYKIGSVVGHSVNSWAFLSLTRQDAHELMSRLETLLAEYLQKVDYTSTTKLYLLHLGMVQSELAKG